MTENYCDGPDTTVNRQGQRFAARRGVPAGANIGPGAICTQVWNGESEKIKMMMEFNGEPGFGGRPRAIKATN